MQRQGLIIALVVIFSCNTNTSVPGRQPGTNKSKSFPKIKPPSTFQDTLQIDRAAAVFYLPDSLQLEKIRSVTDPGAFAANMHEYDYLMRTSRVIIKTHYPQLSIIEAKNIRYLLFITKGKRSECIDLDKNYDPCGIYIFDPLSKPLLTDMANIETNIRFYYSK